MSTLAGATLTLSATVTSDHADPTPANNSDLETTTVTSAGGRTIAVTNTNDSGPGSLRQAIAESNADSGDRDTIVFNIPGAGVHDDHAAVSAATDHAAGDYRRHHATGLRRLQSSS